MKNKNFLFLLISVIFSNNAHSVLGPLRALKKMCFPGRAEARRMRAQGRLLLQLHEDALADLAAWEKKLERMRGGKEYLERNNEEDRIKAQKKQLKKMRDERKKESKDAARVVKNILKRAQEKAELLEKAQLESLMGIPSNKEDLEMDAERPENQMNVPQAQEHINENGQEAGLSVREDGEEQMDVVKTTQKNEDLQDSGSQ